MTQEFRFEPIKDVAHFEMLVDFLGRHVIIKIAIDQAV
jgi:hypothetical protein